MLENDNQITK